MTKKTPRNSKGLRDVLFDEIESLRSGDGDPTRALAIANLAKQVINTVKIELDYHRELARQQDTGNPLKLGTVPLGSVTDAESVASTATGAFVGMTSGSKPS